MTMDQLINVVGTITLVEITAAIPVIADRAAELIPYSENDKRD